MTADNKQLQLVQQNNALINRVAELESRLRIAESVQSKHEVLQMFRERMDGAIYPGAALDAHWKAAQAQQALIDAMYIESTAQLLATINEINMLLSFLEGAAWISERAVLQEALNSYKTGTTGLPMYRYVSDLLMKLTKQAIDIGCPLRGDPATFSAIATAVLDASEGNGGDKLRAAIAERSEIVNQLMQTYADVKGGRTSSNALYRIGKVVADLRNCSPRPSWKDMPHHVIRRLEGKDDVEALALLQMQQPRAKAIEFLRNQYRNVSKSGKN